MKDIQIKKRLSKRHLSIIITASVLAVLITAYVILTAVLPGILANSGTETSTPPEILAGESTHSNKATVYPYLAKANITSVTVGSHKDTSFFSYLPPR